MIGQNSSILEALILNTSRSRILSHLQEVYSHSAIDERFAEPETSGYVRGVDVELKRHLDLSM